MTFGHVQEGMHLIGRVARPAVQHVEQFCLNIEQGRTIVGRYREASSHQICYVLMFERLPDRAASLSPTTPTIVLLPAIETRIDVAMPVVTALANRVDTARHKLVCAWR